MNTQNASDKTTGSPGVNPAGTPTDTSAVEQLLSRTPGLWRGAREAHRLYADDKQIQTSQQIPIGHSGDLFGRLPVNTAADVVAQATGYPELDALLPWGGWPTSGLVEIISKHKGIGELQLLMPLLKQRSQQTQSVLWIAPPYPLHGPALAKAGVNIRNSFVIPAQTSCNKALWSIEKALQSSECGLVLAWQNWLSPRVVRRLQLAAREGQTLGVLFHKRPTPHSPAMLQLELHSVLGACPRTRSVDVNLLKATGTHQRGQVRLKLPC
jgi:cell division inhibitor SulA